MLSLENARNSLSNYRLGVLGQRAVDFLAIRRLAPVEVFIVCEGGEDATLLAGTADLLSPELENRYRKVWTNGSLGGLVDLARKQLGNIFMRNPGKPLHILAYSATLEWEQLAAENASQFHLIAPAALLKIALDDKIYTRQQLSSLGMPVPISIVVDRSQLHYLQLVDRVGERFIVQRPIGSAGIGTHEVYNEEELLIIREASDTQRWLVSAYGGATTLNVHGLVFTTGIEVSSPSVQLTGIPELSANRCSYCGNDYGRTDDISPTILKKAQYLTMKVGEWLLSKGFWGIFGVDIVIQDTTLQILDVNPRLQGSTWLLAELEFELGTVPLVVKHFLQGLGESSNIDNVPMKLGKAAQAILHNNEQYPIRVTHQLAAGVYLLDERGCLINRSGNFSLTDLNDGEFLLFGMPPQSEAVVAPGAVLARLATRSHLASPDGRYLTDFGKRIVKAVAHELRTA